MERSDSWHWQVENTIRSIDKLKEYIHLGSEEEEGIRLAETEFSWHITPYYAGLMKTDDLTALSACRQSRRKWNCMTSPG